MGGVPTLKAVPVRRKHFPCHSAGRQPTQTPIGHGAESFLRPWAASAITQ